MAVEGEAIIYMADTIEYEGKMWLVPEWLEAPSEGWKTPERIVCLDGFPHQKVESGVPADFVLNKPIPKDVLYGQIPKQSKYASLVIMRPDIKVSIPTIH